MRAKQILLGVAIIICVSVVGSAAQVPADLLAAMSARDSSIYTQDTATFARYTADEFTVVSADGSVKTKAIRLQEMRSAKPAPFEAFVDQQVRVYGNVAVRRVLANKGSLRFMDIWVKNATGWQVVAVQITAIKK